MNRRGFTLIELLVVIVIIGILAGLVTVGVTAALNSSKASSSEAMVGTIAGALSQYRSRWGDYPYSTIDEMGGRSPNDLNNGVEALVAGLSSTRRGGALYQPAEEFFCNTDTDSTSANVTGWYFGDNQLREYRDYFGNVIVYLHNKDFARPKSGVTKYRYVLKGKDETIAPMKSEATKTFVNAGRYQLWSIGRDGKSGSADDLSSPN